MASSSLDVALREFSELVGEEHVLVQADALLPYAVSIDPAGDCFPSAVVRPGSLEEVRVVVQIAARYLVPLHPISRGRQHGLGMATAVDRGAVTVDLGRMNQVVAFDAELGYVVIEPGVTFGQLYDFLRERDAPFWVSPTSGPIDASVVGNALDKGAGYTPVGNHFGNLIGLEVVIGDGRVLTTGDGALAGAKSLYTHKGGCGPMLDALMAQSNDGIVTKAGVWLMPAPPGARGFVFQFPEYEDLGRAADVAAQLKLTGQIPSTVSMVNDQFCLGVEAAQPYPTGRPGRPPLSDAELHDSRVRHGMGAWNVVGSVYGPPSELEERVARLHARFATTGAVVYLSEEEARPRKAFGYRFDIAAGIPNETELDVYHFHANGSSLYFLPSIPFRGAEALEAMHLSRAACSEWGFAYTTQFLCSPRSMRNTQSIIFDSTDADSRERVMRCFSSLIDRFETAGYLVSRPPTHFQDRIMSGLGLHAELSAGIKRVFDPNGIIDPGRYGLRVSDQ